MTAIHSSEADEHPLGGGFLIDTHRVLTAAHVVRLNGAVHPELWVAFPKFDELMEHRRWVREVVLPAQNTSRFCDVAVLVLAEAVPQDFAPRLRRPAPSELVGGPWWSFGFPDGVLGNSSDGTVGESLGYGWVRLDTGSRYPVGKGFSGAAVWSPAYQAVVALIGQARHDTGDARALTLWQVDRCLPEQQLQLLTDWSVEAAGEDALAAWGWSLETDPEAGRHWRPRARGVNTDAERGFRFRGRIDALKKIVAWITDSVPRRQILVVTGSPGVGKSAVLGRVITTADSGISASLPPEDEAVRAPEGSVACAVHAKGKTVLEVAREIARAASAPLPDQVGDLAPALRTVLGGEPSGLFAVVIDALDEATTPEDARTIVGRIVLPLAETCADLGVRIVVGCRRRDSEGNLLAVFGRAGRVLDLDASEFFAESDLVSYVLATLRLCGDERSGNPYTREDIALPVASRISELAEGNFLVAGLIARSHGMHDQEPVEPAQISFPSTVDAALREYLALLPPVGPLPAVDALTALAYVEAPGLSIALWATAITGMFGTAPTTRELRAFAHSAAANFLIETSASDSSTGVYRLFHQALNDALLRTRIENDSLVPDEQGLTQAFIDEGRAHGWHAAPSYLLRSLPRHAARGGFIDELLIDDTYLLHADLRRLIPSAAGASTSEARDRAHLLRRTPRAIDATSSTRVALFSVTEAQERRGNAYRAIAVPAPYRAVWAAVTPATEEAVLEGHIGGVRGVCSVLVSGHVLLASASDDATARIWDPATGEHFRTLKGHTRALRDVCGLRTQERTLLASASDDATARIWDPATGEHLHTLKGHRGGVRGVCAVHLADRTLLASASNDRTIRIWDPDTGQHLHTLEGHTRALRGVCAVHLADRTLLASASNDRTIRIWDPDTGQHLHTLEGHTGGVLGVCAIQTSGRALLASASNDRTIRIWDPDTGQHMRSLEGHTDWARGVCEVRMGDRNLLASVGNLAVRVWDPDTGQQLHALEGHSWARKVCAVRVGNRTLLASAGDRTVRVWDPDTGQQPRIQHGHTDWVREVSSVRVTGRTLVASAGDRTVRIWNATTGEHLHTLEGHTDWVNAVCALPMPDHTL
ncbi:trypsin-like peptidase domain-containing protein, partial [Streptomyces sp. B6B3]|uniref:trypsin-like peptidase domain-containing protein n=1 Tax=Streptomyces sp. B6B3 TaxID=3153570 RepID=UPI00325CC000